MAENASNSLLIEEEEKVDLTLENNQTEIPDVTDIPDVDEDVSTDEKEKEKKDKEKVAKETTFPLWNFLWDNIRETAGGPGAVAKVTAEQVIRQHKERKRKEDPKYVQDAQDFTTWLNDNYFKNPDKLEELTGAASLHNISLDNEFPLISSAVRDQLKMGLFQGDVDPNNKVRDIDAGRTEFKNLTNTDIDNIIESTFYKEVVNEKRRVSDLKTYAEIKRIESEGKGDLESVLNTMDNHFINSLESPAHREIATINKYIREKTGPKGEELDDESIEKYQGRVSELYKELDIKDNNFSVLSGDYFVKTTKRKMLFDTENNQVVIAPNELQLETDLPDISTNFNINMTELSHLLLSDKDRYHQKYNEFLLENSFHNNLNSQQEDFITDNFGLVNALRNNKKFKGQIISLAESDLSDKRKQEIFGEFAKQNPSLWKKLGKAPWNWSPSEFSKSAPGLENIFILKDIPFGIVGNMGPKFKEKSFGMGDIDLAKGRDPGTWASGHRGAQPSTNSITLLDGSMTIEEYEDFIESHHSHGMDLKAKEQVFKYTHHLGIDISSLPKNPHFRAWESLKEGFGVKPEISDTFSNIKLMDFWQDLSTQEGFPQLTDAQRDALERDTYTSVTEGIGGAGSIMVGLLGANKIQAGIMATTKLGNAMKIWSTARYQLKNGKFISYSSLTKRVLAKNKGSKQDLPTLVTKYMHKYGIAKVAPSNSTKAYGHFVNLAFEGVKMEALLGPEGGAEIGFGFYGVQQLFPQLKNFTGYNRLNTLAKLVFNRAPAFAVGSEFGHVVHGLSDYMLANNKEFRKFIDDEYPDYDTVEKRAIVNLWLGGFFGATHLKNVDLKSTVGLRRLQQNVMERGNKLVDEGRPNESKTHTKYDYSTQRFYTEKDFAELTKQRDIYQMVSDRFEASDEIEAATNPKTRNTYWGRLFKPIIDMYHKNNQDLEIVAKDKLDGNRNASFEKTNDGGKIEIGVYDAANKGSIVGHEGGHAALSLLFKGNPVFKQKFVKELEGIADKVIIVEAGNKSLLELIRSEKNISKELQPEEIMMYLSQYLGKQGYYETYVAQNLFMNLKMHAYSWLSQAGIKEPGKGFLNSKNQLQQWFGELIVQNKMGWNPGKQYEHLQNMVEQGLGGEFKTWNTDGKGNPTSPKVESTDFGRSAFLSAEAQNRYEQKIKPLQTESDREKAFEDYYVTKGNAKDMVMRIIHDKYPQLTKQAKQDLYIDMLYDPFAKNPRGLLALTEEYHAYTPTKGKTKQPINQMLIKHLQLRIHEIAVRGKHIKGEGEGFNQDITDPAIQSKLAEQGYYEPAYDFINKAPSSEKIVKNKLKILDKINADPEIRGKLSVEIREIAESTELPFSFTKFGDKTLATIRPIIEKVFGREKGESKKEYYQKQKDFIFKNNDWLYEALVEQMDLKTGESTLVMKTFGDFYKPIGERLTGTGIPKIDKAGPQIFRKKSLNELDKKALYKFIFKGDRKDVHHNRADKLIDYISKLTGNQVARELLSNKGFQDMLGHKFNDGRVDIMNMESVMATYKNQMTGAIGEKVWSRDLIKNIHKNWETLSRFSDKFKTAITLGGEDKKLIIDNIIRSDYEIKKYFEGDKYNQLIKDLKFDVDPSKVEFHERYGAGVRLLGTGVKVYTPDLYSSWADFRKNIETSIEGLKIGEMSWEKKGSQSSKEYDAFIPEISSMFPKEVANSDLVRHMLSQGMGESRSPGEIYRNAEWFETMSKDLKHEGTTPDFFKHIKVTVNDAFRANVASLLKLPQFKGVKNGKNLEEFHKTVILGGPKGIKGLVADASIKERVDKYMLPKNKGGLGLSEKAAKEKVRGEYKELYSQLVESNKKGLNLIWGTMYDYIKNSSDKTLAINNVWRTMSVQSNQIKGIKGLATHKEVTLESFDSKKDYYSEHNFQLLNYEASVLKELLAGHTTKESFLDAIKTPTSMFNQSIIPTTVQQKFDKKEHGGRTGFDFDYTSENATYAWIRNNKILDNILDLTTGKTKGQEMRDVINNSEVVKIVKSDQNKSINILRKSDLDIPKDLSNAEVLEWSVLKDKAIEVSNDKNAPKRSMTASDFDYVSSLTKEKVAYTLPDGTKGKLNGIQFAERYNELKEKGAEFDYTEFNDVINAKKGPFFNVIEQLAKKHGTQDIFIVSARPQDAAKGIQRFFKEFGVDIKLENIVGLEDGRASAKAKWILGKVGDGYNDILFADDVKANVDAVAKILKVTNINGEARHIMNSIDLSKDFNDIMENRTGIASHKIYSDAKAATIGASKGNFTFYIPPSAENFVGLIYPTLAKGKQGDAQMAWYKRNLLDPFARGESSLAVHRRMLMGDYNALKAKFKADNKAISKKLNKKAPGSDWTYQNAIRIRNWLSQGMEVPGLSVADGKAMVKLVNETPGLADFANGLININKGLGYVEPGAHWLVGTISSDLQRGLNSNTRAKYLKQWIDNKNIIFSKENLNKYEVGFGTAWRGALENMLQRMESGNNRRQLPGTLGKVENKVLDYVNNSTAVIMTLNSRSALLQLTSTLNYVNWHDNNPLKVGKTLANVPQYAKDFLHIYNSDYLTTRREGVKLNIAESEVADALNSSKNGPAGLLDLILKKGFVLTKHADSFAIASGGASFYRNRINTYIKQGLPESKAREKAFKDFQELTEEAQQSSRTDQISMQQASNLGRVVLAFANTPMQYARLQKRAIQDIINNRGDLKTNLSKLTYYSFVQNLIFNSLQQAWFGIALDDDPDDQRQAVDKSGRLINGMLDSQLRGLGWQGAGVAAVKNMLFKAYEQQGKSRTRYQDIAMEALKVSPPISSKITKFRSAGYALDYNYDEMVEKGWSLESPAYLASANVIEAATNIPIARMIRKMENIQDAMDEDRAMWMKLALLAGYASWELEPDPDLIEKGPTSRRLPTSTDRRQNPTTNKRRLPGQKRKN